ncbi:hypothetical protein [Bowmanella dokdonensis]|uniref:Uncharacterized protein n=1 Tax=Bowmanella dokdonensis TaxID=751969 RepID=A0A939DJ50_9ALTE|nr:hypothetical protein [Bowmanella dokdonensis]MBN7823669.1 hypothetical protein [Bowmanella dokdonensis]
MENQDSKLPFTANPSPAIPLWQFGLLASLLPLLTIHLTLLVSFWQDALPHCNPYWLDCVSISATGRYGLAYFLFKAGMIPAMVLLALFWTLNSYWLKSLGLGSQRYLGWLGVVASLALIVYSLSLGHVGETFYLLRRAGVVIYLGLTFIAQACLGAALASHPSRPMSRSGRRLLLFSALTLFIAIFSLALDGLWPVWHERMEDAFEWWLVLLLNLHAVWVAVLWRRLGFVARMGVR